MQRKKPGRKAEPPSRRRIAWPRWTGFRGKTVWDFLQLLIVPLMLAAIGFWFTAQQDNRQQQVEDERAQQAQKIENQRAEAEQELAKQGAQDEALQAYLDQMGNLLLEKDLRDSERGSEVRTLARARTATVMQRLDSDRNRNIIAFLTEANLLGRRDSVRLLAGVDLRGAHLQDADLSETDLSETDLRHANLRDADLEGVDLRDADLRDADLRGSFTNYSDLNWADMRYADLTDAKVVCSDLDSADLSHADLHRAWLWGPDLSNAVLRYADLSDARKVTNQQIARAGFLEGATLPNGQEVPRDQQKAEKWLRKHKAFSSFDLGLLGKSDAPGEKMQSKACHGLT